MSKIVTDDNIIFVDEAFSEFGEVIKIPGRKISNNDIKNADILLVRSITKVDKELLENTMVKFVGTATIGSDHIDKDYLKSQNIFFTDAAGCNADAVAEYVFTALFEIISGSNFKLKEKTIGVIGVGNIGSRIAKIAESLGLKVFKNDPPLKRLTGREDYWELDELMNADIITLHVPLNKDGIDKTAHLFDSERLNKLKDGAILINASRGQVIDNSALIKFIKKKKLKAILDVWENEPQINTELLKRVKIGTPHVAGYSLEGKVNGTVMLYNSLCNFLNKKSEWKPDFPRVKNNEFIVSGNELNQSLTNLFSNIYNIKNDDKRLRKTLDLDEKEKSKYFDSLRKNYPLRREFSNYNVFVKNINSDTNNILRNFRFNIINLF